MITIKELIDIKPGDVIITADGRTLTPLQLERDSDYNFTLTCKDGEIFNFKRGFYQDKGLEEIKEIIKA